MRCGPITITNKIVLVLYYIELKKSMLQWACLVIDHRRCQNEVRTLVTHSTATCQPLLVLTTFWSHLWSTLLLKRNTETRNLFNKLILWCHWVSCVYQSIWLNISLPLNVDYCCRWWLVVLVVVFIFIQCTGNNDMWKSLSWTS